MRKYTKRKPMRLCDVKAIAITNTKRPLISANDDISAAAAKLIASGWASPLAGRRREHEEDEAPAAFTYTGYVPARPKAIKPKAERQVLVVRRNAKDGERTERIDVKGRR